MKTTAIILAAGSGSRMKSTIKKQYMMMNEKPVLYYSLMAFEKSSVDSIILVTNADDIDYCKETVIERYGFCKISHIVAGGKERYHSVYEGLKACEGTDAVLIHDGARPFIKTEQINGMIDAILEYPAIIAGMPTKDTVKITDDFGIVKDTPNRNRVWMVQTPQCFHYAIVRRAYDRMISEESIWKNQGYNITDDAMVCELFSDVCVRMMQTSYRNIKITTPEDIEVARGWIDNSNLYQN